MISNISPLLNILLLSLMASIGTGIGGLVAIIRSPGRRAYGLLMGFTAGVMICLSFLELVNQAWELAGPWTATIGFGIGATFMFLLDHFAPHIRFGEKEIRGLQEIPRFTSKENYGPRRFRYGRLRCQNQTPDLKLVNTGFLLAIGITLHNLPEGIAIGAGYLHNPKFGLFITVAILLHNIPEGIATALPLSKGGICRGDAFMSSVPFRSRRTGWSLAGESVPGFIWHFNPWRAGVCRRGDGVYYPGRIDSDCARVRS